MEKTPQMRCIEFDRGRELEEIIRSSIESGASLGAVAEELGITRLTLREWMKRLGLRIESRRELVGGVAREARVG